MTIVSDSMTNTVYRPAKTFRHLKIDFSLERPYIGYMFGYLGMAIKKIWQSSIILRHFIFWTSAFLSFFLTVLFIENFGLALRIAAFIIAPAPIPVYLHFLSMKLFFEKRKYVYYVISLIFILVLSGFIFERFFYFILNDPEGNTSGILMALFFVVFSTGMKYFKEGITKQYRFQEDRFKQVQTELALLKSQVNPHFFFNTLNSLYALSLEKSDQVPDVVLKLSDLMRYVLDSSNKKTVPLEDEVQFLKSYISLEQLRLPEKTDIRVSVKGDLQTHCIAPMLLIPFVDNSFKHGLSSSIGDGYIHVSITIERKNLHFQVKNSKPQPESRDKTERPGMGLENVKRRIALLYPDKHQLNIADNPKSYCVELLLNLKP
jgi:hypothetical protein